jgi:hypothetical protein
MAHFAELNNDNVVIRIVVIDNENCQDANGVESEAIGIQFCQNLFGGKWIQTSYTGSIRSRFAGINYIYHEDLDVFTAPQPNSWYVLNESFNWVVPIGIKPDTGTVLTEEEWNWLDKVFAIDHNLLNRGYRNV